MAANVDIPHRFEAVRHIHDGITKTDSVVESSWPDALAAGLSVALGSRTRMPSVTLPAYHEHYVRALMGETPRHHSGTW